MAVDIIHGEDTTYLTITDRDGDRVSINLYPPQFVASGEHSALIGPHDKGVLISHEDWKTILEEYHRLLVLPT